MTTEQMTRAAMLVSGRFEGNDPWANITGNMDGQGLTCGQLGKTFADGEQQLIVKAYLAKFGDAELRQFMPIKAQEYLDAVKASTAKGTALVAAWSHGKSKVDEPYNRELAAFWKSAKMVQMQIEHALGREGKDSSAWMAAWAGDGSLHEFEFFFDIAVQGGSLKNLTHASVTSFLGSNPAAKVATIIAWCKGAPASAAGSKDAKKNGLLWEQLLAHASDDVRDLFVLAYLRAQKASSVWQFDFFNRKGTMAVGEGWVHGDKWNLHDEFDLAGQPATPAVVEPVVKTPVAPPAPAAPAVGAMFRVHASDGLNLRSTPSSKDKTNILVLLPEGTLVRFVDSTTDAAWWKVSTDLNGKPAIGCVAAAYLVGVAAPTAPPVAVVPVAPATAPAVVSVPTPAAASVVAVHLSISPGHVVKRSDPNGRAFPLNEAGLLSRSGATDNARAKSVAAIIQWLDVESGARYLPTNGMTFCNIYAYDYACLCGVYLPRVWWTEKAIVKLTQGQTVVPSYQNTVDELTANDLPAWFRSWGPSFGWRQTTSLDDLQANANKGGVSFIVARNSQGHGHITAIVPETDAHQAARSGGHVERPLESQAGSSNYKYITKSSQWWTAAKYSPAFWMHD